MASTHNTEEFRKKLFHFQECNVLDVQHRMTVLPIEYEIDVRLTSHGL